MNVYDIRDRQYIEAQDLLTLNFIRSSAIFAFRRHFRTGLRSHLFEVLKPEDLKKESNGIHVGEYHIFPRATPVKMLRLFRARFAKLEEALEEIARVKLIIRYLAPNHVAKSNEFLVSYRIGGIREILLCGLQEYIPGEILDPWAPLDDQAVAELLNRASSPHAGYNKVPMPDRIENTKNQVRSFVSKVKKMIAQAGHIPDLAGIGNLIITADGQLKLVDINNISPISLDKSIFRDDHGYPVCDKSIEALALLERKVLGNPLPAGDALYRIFLEPARMRAVLEMVRTFTLSPEKRM